MLIYDSITIADLPSDTTALLAYVDGSYANLAAAKARFPNAVILTVSEGAITTCAISLTNVGGTALFAADAAVSVVGTALDKPTLARAAAAGTAIAEPAADGRGSAEYRAKMAGVMTTRALTRAFARAKS